MMKRRSRPTPPKKRSPVPPPERIIGDTSYQRRNDRHSLHDAITEFERERPSISIKLVILGLDGALWAVEAGSCDSLHPPLRRVDDSTASDASDTKVTLARDARRLLQWLQSKNVLIAVVNRSRSENAVELLNLFGLRECFARAKIAREPMSHLIKTIQGEIQAKRGLQLAPGEVLLVGDDESDLRDVDPLGIQTALIGREIQALAELPTFLSRR